jgi:hypothetical protein
VVGSLTLLTPVGALAALAALVPLAAAVVGAGRVTRARALLGLGRPPLPRSFVVAAAMATSMLALGVAAGQPALSRTRSEQVRRDAQAMFLIDTSRSMLASRTRSSPTRLRRAKHIALVLRAAIQEVAAGVGTLTDRALPNLLPVPEDGGFAATVARAVGVDEPPPREVSIRATTYAALADVAAGNYFSAGATHRVLAVLTDGESRPFDAREVARQLAQARIRLVLVQVWGSTEAIFGASGRPEPAYEPDPTARLPLDSLAAAAGGRRFGENEVAAAAAYLRTLVGKGPTVAAPVRVRRITPLAPYVALAALLPLAFAYWRWLGT